MVGISATNPYPCGGKAISWQKKGAPYQLLIDMDPFVGAYHVVGFWAPGKNRLPKCQPNGTTKEPF